MLRHVRLNPRPLRQAFVGQILHPRPLNPSLSSDDRRPGLSPTFRSPHLEKGTCNCFVAHPGSYLADSPLIMHDKRPPTPMGGNRKCPIEKEPHSPPGWRPFASITSPTAHGEQCRSTRPQTHSGPVQTDPNNRILEISNSGEASRSQLPGPVTNPIRSMVSHRPQWSFAHTVHYVKISNRSRNIGNRPTKLVTNYIKGSRAARSMASTATSSLCSSSGSLAFRRRRRSLGGTSTRKQSSCGRN
jgi:hypothetical protein